MEKQHTEKFLVRQTTSQASREGKRGDYSSHGRIFLNEQCDDVDISKLARPRYAAPVANTLCGGLGILCYADGLQIWDNAKLTVLSSACEASAPSSVDSDTVLLAAILRIFWLSVEPKKPKNGADSCSKINFRLRRARLKNC